MFKNVNLYIINGKNMHPSGCQHKKKLWEFWLGLVLPERRKLRSSLKISFNYNQRDKKAFLNQLGQEIDLNYTCQSV